MDDKINKILATIVCVLLVSIGLVLSPFGLIHYFVFKYKAKKDKHEYHLNLIKTNDLDSIRQVIKTEVLFRAYLKIMEKFESNNLLLEDRREYYNTVCFEWTDNAKTFRFDVCQHLKSYTHDRKGEIPPVIIVNDYHKGELAFWVTVFDHLHLEQLREEMRQIEIRKERRKKEQQEAVDKFFSHGHN